MPSQTQMIESLMDRQRWFELRDEYMDAARRNMAALMQPSILPGYSFNVNGTIHVHDDVVLREAYDRNHPMVVESNTRWVAKARRCHRLGMGFDPVFDMMIIGSEGLVEQRVYAGGTHA